MPLNPPCCENAMQFTAREMVAKLLPYLATQPRTPALVELVRGLVVFHPEFAKLMNLFIEPTPPATN